MRLGKCSLCAVMLVALAGCASNPQQAPKIQRISAEELERLIPKPMPKLPLEDVVALSKQGETADAIIAKIKLSGSRYALTPSQAIDLNRRGVDGKVLDYMYAARERALRDGFADAINKREQEHQNKLAQLRQTLQLRSWPDCDPFWPYPYWRYHYLPRGYYW